MPKTKIQLLVTGGTIAKKYNEIDGTLVFDEKNTIKMLNRTRNTLDIEVKQLMLKDSLDMNNIDRDIILKNCKISKYDKIVITHGTDTMTRSAKKLASIQDKTIVFTGAMIPFSFKNSDALFNLGFALSSVQLLPHGIYICMNGGIFSYNNVQKNKQKGLFENIF